MACRGISRAFGETVSRLPADDPRARALLEGRPLYAQTDDLDKFAEVINEGFRAFALIPLCYEGTVVAILTLGSHWAREIPPQSRMAVEALAAQTAGAIARIRAQSALRNSENRLRTVITGAPLFVFAADSQGRITFEDGKALHALGWAPGQRLGRKVEEVYRDYPLVLENSRRASRGEEFNSTVSFGSTVLDFWYPPCGTAPETSSDTQVSPPTSASASSSNAKFSRSATASRPASDRTFTTACASNSSAWPLMQTRWNAS